MYEGLSRPELVEARDGAYGAITEQHLVIDALNREILKRFDFSLTDEGIVLERYLSHFGEGSEQV